MAHEANAVRKLRRVIIRACLSFFVLRCLTPGNVHAVGAQDAARAYNRFGFQLLNQCRATLSQKNFFLSPAGVALALSMIENGARGPTLREMMTVLQTQNLPLPELNEANKALLDRLTSLDPKIQLEIANALWLDKKAEVEPQFTSVNHDSYNAEIAGADFQDPATVKSINDWVSSHT
jgi:serpin B